MVLEVQGEEGTSRWIPRLSGQCNSGSVESSLLREIFGIECAANAKLRVITAERVNLDLITPARLSADVLNGMFLETCDSLVLL